MERTREDFHRGLMRAYALMGRADEAIDQYRRCERILREEIGVEPSPRTQALFRAIREGSFPPVSP